MTCISPKLPAPILSPHHSPLPSLPLPYAPTSCNHTPRIEDETQPRRPISTTKTAKQSSKAKCNPTTPLSLRHRLQQTSTEQKPPRIASSTAVQPKKSCTLPRECHVASRPKVEGEGGTRVTNCGIANTVMGELGTARFPQSNP